MKCMKCGKEMFKSTTTEAIELGFGVLVIRNIPCYKCTECDEIFYTGDIVQKIEEITERVKLLVQEVTVVDFEKAAQEKIMTISERILDAASIERIYVNGKTAEKYYKKYIEKSLGIKAFCLPSTSPANAAWNFDRLIEAWKVIREI